MSTTSTIEAMGGKVFDLYGAGIVKNTSTGRGHGHASVTLLPNGLAVINFSVKLISMPSTEDFNFGVDPSGFSSLTGGTGLPTITPVNGGWWQQFNNSGALNTTNFDCGTTLQYVSSYGKWVFSRIWKNGSTYSKNPWGTASFAANDRIIGTCYGTY